MATIFVGRGEAPSDGDITERYEFDTEAEATAFEEGLAVAHGWHEIRVFKEERMALGNRWLTAEKYVHHTLKGEL